MMGVTHAMVGLLLATTTQATFASLQLTAAIAAFTGGLFPDLDLVFEHRKTLHFPVIYTLLTLILAPIVSLMPSVFTIAVFYFLLSAAIHSWMDIFGGGLEHKPWIPSSEKAIYSYTLKMWLPPRRWIRYDGAPEDFLLTVLIAIPCYLYYPEGILTTLIALSVVIGGIYTIFRKKLLEWTPQWIQGFF